MSEEIKKQAKELKDGDLAQVAGGYTGNNTEIPDWYVYCLYDSVNDFEFCEYDCKLHGTSDCIDRYYNPHASRR